MGRAAFSAALAAAMLIGAGSTHAADFDFSFGDPYTSGSAVDTAAGTLTASVFGDNAYQVTEISGSYNGETITGLSDFDGADNLIFPGESPVLDANGLGFTTDGKGSDGLGNVNVYFDTYTDERPDSGYTDAENSSVALNGTFSLMGESTVSAAPEPSTWALMLGGAGILGHLLRLSFARLREDQASGMAEA